MAQPKVLLRKSESNRSPRGYSYLGGVYAHGSVEQIQNYDILYIEKNYADKRNGTTLPSGMHYVDAKVEGKNQMVHCVLFLWRPLDMPWFQKGLLVELTDFWGRQDAAEKFNKRVAHI